MFDENGVCNYCRSFERFWGAWMRSEELRAGSERELLRVFEWARGKEKGYDALVPLSGGKDSSYALHLCASVYGLNVLTFTNDNGFLTDCARENIAKMIGKLGVDHSYHTEPLMVDIARHFFVNTGHFCAPCNLGIFSSNYMIAEKHDIPLLVYGNSSRTDASFPKEVNPWSPWYFRKVLKGSDLAKKMASTVFGRNYLIRFAVDRLMGKRKVILLPDYLEWNEDDFKKILEGEYGLVFKGTHSDCMFAPVAAYLQKTKNSGVDAATIKYSLSIRNGLIDRDTALIRAETPGDEPSEEIARFIEKLHLTPLEFERASRLSPAPYLEGMPALMNRARKIIRKQ
jgi:hypothetical protein